MNANTCISDAGKAQESPAEDDILCSHAAMPTPDLWKDICESVADMAFETDAAGKFVFLSPPIVLGFSAEDLIGHLAVDVFCVRLGAPRVGVNPFCPSLAIRIRRVYLKRRDGTTAVYAMSARPNRAGGARGIAIDVSDQEASDRNAEVEIRARSALDRIVAKMRDQVLAPAIIRAGLSELQNYFGAEGVAIVHHEREVTTTGDFDKAIAVASHVAGDGFAHLAPALGLLNASRPSIDDQHDGPPVVTDVGATGRSLLTCPIRNRLGQPEQLVIWMLEQRNWRSEDRMLVGSMAITLRSAIETDHVARELTRQARTDILTGLLHRRSFAEEVQRRLDRLDRNCEHATILSIDLDDFGALNADCGQEAGDEALRHAAAILRDAVRPTDLVGRIGGDEFVIWLDGADSFAAAERAETICRNGIPSFSDVGLHRLSLSIGLASRSPRSAETFESLLRRADVAVANAKRSGKGAWRASRQEIET